MSAIPIWNYSLTVGNAELDAHHIMLFELGRDLVEALKAKSSTHERIHDLLKDVTMLSQKHDDVEEQILAQNLCPTLSEHKELHKASRAKLTRFLMPASQNQTDRQALAQAVTDWMSHHLSENDLRVKEFINY